MILLLAVAAILGVSAFYDWKTFFVIFLFILLLYLFTSSKKVISYVLITIVLYFLISHLHAYFNQTTVTTSNKSLIVRMTELPDINGSTLQTIVTTSSEEKIVLRYSFKSAEEKQAVSDQYKLGLTCAISGQLEQPDNHRNENAFNYRQYLWNQKINWILKSEQNPLKACKNMKPKLIEKIKSIRLKSLQHIERYFPSEAKGFSAALLFGESDWIEEETYNAYKSLSLVHILAISGLHVAIITACLFYIGIRLGLTRETTQSILIVLLPIYGVIAGGAPSVVRACVMVMAFLILSLCRIKVSSVSLLSSIFLLLMFINPFYLQQVGFQLSFFITFALLMSAKILASVKHHNKIVQSLIVTVICQLCSLPIILYYFHEFSVWGFLANIVYIPLYTVVLLPVTFIAFLFSVLHAPFSSLLLKLLECFFIISNDTAVLLSRIPFASLSFGKPSFLFTMFLTSVILLLFYFWEQKNRKPIFICVSLLLLSLFVFYHKVSLSPVGEVVVIDVGQGDSILIKRPFGKGIYLIDTGGVLLFSQDEWRKKRKSFEPGEDIVVPFLKSKGIRKIDKLILTHDDQDHIGGANAVMKAMRVKEIVIPEALRKDFIATAMWEGAIKERSKMTLLEDGEGWRRGKDTFRVVHPVKYTGNSNESSLVLLATINGVRWLFTGDLGEEGEQELIRRYPQLEVDVLKVGHHGSKHSSSPLFLNQLNARVAVVSAGRNNRYNHPSPEVLELLQERNIHLLRTDQNGAIQYKYLWGRGTFSVTLP
ncbi:DNA internalization-related competence protein ComEC/Rec2 [Bacillus massiliigorillae]|uniref:DNA internalization-related competence protein ComEC/Rec2 n=1 Tax=Bacillus massiliigorillae TaxID=1243664 RepID=UPI0003AACD98|nr:DNA internalization-related competence protein ComEC/Rec2 [Bacillus massiliigorillae]